MCETRSTDAIPSDRRLMTRQEFQAYFATLAPLMRLGHWILQVGDRPPTSGNAWASVVCWDGRNGATIYLSDGILKESPEEQRYVAVHELTHCHFAQSDKLAEGDMSPSKSEAWRLAMEYAVDSVAQSLAPHMPLPPVIEKADPSICPGSGPVASKTRPRRSTVDSTI